MHENSIKIGKYLQNSSFVTLHIGLVASQKESFLDKRKSKLMPKGDKPFRILERINDNAYKLELLGEYGVSATFHGNAILECGAHILLFSLF